MRRFRNHAVRLLVVSIIAMVIASYGCASKSAYTGHPSTDLGSVEKGTSREIIEQLLGRPDRTEKKADGTLAWYVYDRGFIGNLEMISAGEKLLWAPVMAFGELTSLGLAGWMTACQAPCQKGWLMIEYDDLSQVLSASEAFLPDDHTLVKDCARSPVRGDIAVCQGVRTMVRPSTLRAQPLVDHQ